MSNYYNLKVKEIIKETTDTVTICLKQPLFKKIKYKAGQYLTVIFKINGQEVRRPYSMSSTSGLDNTVDFTVKRVEGGLVSNHINDNIKIGESIKIMEPIGNFALETNKTFQRHIVLIGAGSGITPLMSMLKSILFIEPKSVVSLVYGNRNEGSIIFEQKLKELKDKFGDRFNLVYSLSQPTGQWNGYKGRIDEEKITNILNLLPKLPSDQTEYFLCGPNEMMENAEKGLKKHKVPSRRIHKESFFATETNLNSNTAADLQDRKINFSLEGRSYELPVASGKSILDAALDEGIDAPFSCQSGLCTACRGKKISGEVLLKDPEGLSDQEINDDYILTCVCYPLTDDVSIEIG